MLAKFILKEMSDRKLWQVELLLRLQTQQVANFGVQIANPG